MASDLAAGVGNAAELLLLLDSLGSDGGGVVEVSDLGAVSGAAREERSSPSSARSAISSPTWTLDVLFSTCENVDEV